MSRDRDESPRTTSDEPSSGDDADRDALLEHLGLDPEEPSNAARESIQPLPARQKRSRETLARLLDAAEEILAEKGYEGATVPAIASRADLSVGVIYRRFEDKDALLRAVWGRFFARVRQWKGGPPPWKHGQIPETAEGAVRWLVGNLIRTYRQHRRILRALTMYARTHPDPAFREEAAAMNAESVRLTGLLLRPFRDRIRHPDPDAAIRNGLLFVTTVLREAIVYDDVPRPGIDLREEDLEDEATRLLLGYLGLGPDA